MRISVIAPLVFVACIDQTTPTTSAVSTSHTLFINFDGVTVMPGADDPATNTSSIPTAVSTIGGYAPTSIDRTTAIAAVVGDLTAILAPYKLDVVTARPPHGTYDMIVVTTDTAASVGVDSTEVVALAPDQECAHDQPPIVGFVFATALGVHEIAATALEQSAQSHGVPMSSLANDCMCDASTGCTPTLPGACTIGGATTPVSDFMKCRSGVMNEAAEFARVFGKR
jgi:hypothetical protein